MSYQHTRNRVRDKHKTAQQDNIDKQILCLHKAMAEKLIANHHYISHVLETIEVRYECGKMRHGAFLFWSSLMEHIHQPELFLTTVLDNSPQAQKYRRQTPFVGILTEQERQTALDQITFT
jgi:nucleoside-triphosphatase THEP1